jgi:HSP20 family molecular chaperone IbpA
MVAWRGFLVNQQYPVPVIRNFWSLYRPSDMRSVFRDVERAVERFERDMIDHFPFRRPRSIPIQGVVQRGDVYRVNVDVDGFKPEEINISVKENALVIGAKMERKAEDGSKFQQEFTREMTLPEEVDLTTLKSFLSNDGVLSIEASYKSEAKPKEIPVNRE